MDIPSTMHWIQTRNVILHNISSSFKVKRLWINSLGNSLNVFDKETAAWSLQWNHHKSDQSFPRNKTVFEFHKVRNQLDSKLFNSTSNIICDSTYTSHTLRTIQVGSNILKTVFVAPISIATTNVYKWLNKETRSQISTIFWIIYVHPPAIVPNPLTPYLMYLQVTHAEPKL